MKQWFEIKTPANQGECMEDAPPYDEAIGKAMAAAQEADEAQEARDRRGGLVDPDSSARRALAWATVAQAQLLREIYYHGAGPEL